MIKWATQTYNLFSNIAAKLVKERCYKFYYPYSNMSCNKSGLAGCEKLLPKVESSSNFATKSVHVARFIGPRPANVTYFNSPVRLESRVIFIQSDVSVHTTCRKLICCKTGVNVGGKTCNIAFQLVLQQCFETSCTFLLPFCCSFRFRYVMLRSFIHSFYFCL